MELNEVLTLIKNELFHGSADYTKNQPDLFLAHRSKILAPSQVGEFIENVKESMRQDAEVLLYVHLPFCFSECLFCNTFPHKTEDIAQRTYLDNLEKEIRLFAKHGVFDSKKIRGIYFGGGTPTSFPNSEIRRILETIDTCAALSDKPGISVEAHPATLSDKKRIEDLASMGVTRLSIGCQTFDQEILGLCNRKNEENRIEKIVRDVQDAGMSINMDMMTGLPGQTIESVRKDMAIVERIRPNAVEYIRHEIVNPLIIKLYNEKPALVVNNDALFEMVYMTQEWMGANGYEQNGSFTSDKHWGFRYYWLQEMPIIAFGSRARSYTKTIFFDKHEELSTYASMVRKQLPPVGRYIFLTEREQMYRSFFLNLQFQRGLDIKAFEKRFEEDPLKTFSPLIEKLIQYGCIEQKDDFIRLTKYGAYFVEDVCDYIIDTLLKEGNQPVVRAPHSEGGRPSKRLS